MIARMSKVAVIGPKELAMEVLGVVQRLEMLQVDPNSKSIPYDLETSLKIAPQDEEALAQGLFYKELKEKIDAFLALLPEIPGRTIFLSPAAAAASVAAVVDQHMENWRDLERQKAALQKEIAELSRHAELLGELIPLLPEEKLEPGLDFLGMVIEDTDAFHRLERLMAEKSAGRFDLYTKKAQNGKEIGLLVAEKEITAMIASSLDEGKMPAFKTPASLAALSPAEQQKAVESKIAGLRAEVDRLEKKMQTFAKRWRGIYQLVRPWLGERLALLRAAGALFETELCFIIFGWLPARDLPVLRETIRDSFQGRVVVEERELLEQDIESVPIVLQNPAYFQPFEIFARLLPVPSYSSFDLTPFLALFFPVFFGMMLGDMGYGAVLLITGLVLYKVCAGHRYLLDMAKILSVCALYTIFFGWLFGEFFGTAGRFFWGLEPAYINRHESLVPMLYFALTVGVLHIILGLILGTATAVKKREKKEALFKCCSIVFVFCTALVVISFRQEALFAELQRPLLISLGIMAPVLLVTGGLMAPLEVLKTFGNIISYVRIMAIGLTSVLLAYVANHLAGTMGSIWVGVLVAVLLHAFNILLGVFAPTIHSLRLHYVEFLGKFTTAGGKSFTPLTKEE